MSATVPVPEPTRPRRRIGHRIGWRIAALILASGLAVTALTGCAASAAPGLIGVGERVVVLTTGAKHEPRPMLTARALAALRDAAQSRNVTDGLGGIGSVALVATADGHLSESLPLTPRRDNGEVEHGLRRDDLIEANVRKVSDTVADTTATEPGMDLLQGIDDAVAGVDDGVLILVSNGLSTDGGFDLRQVGWQADPEHIAAQLRERGLLPDLAGWRVLFTGLGATAGDQPPLPKPTRDKLIAYWQAICVAAGGSCEFDNTRFGTTPPVATVEQPVVPIPDVTSVTGPNGEVTTTLSDVVLGFAGDSAALSQSARDLLRETAVRINARLTDRPDAVVTVRGYTADPPPSTPESRRQLSQQRAKAVAAALTGWIPNQVVAVGDGAAPGTTAVVNGAFDEDRASQMRRVEITY